MSKVLVNESSLSSIGNAIREKNGETTKYKPSQMAAAISAITTGGGGGDDCNGLHLPEEALTITGSCQHRFSNGGWDWFINEFDNKITTNNITSANYMFYYSKCIDIPFELNFSNGNISLQNCFENCEKLTSPPIMNNLKVDNYSNLFYACRNLREFPEDYGANWDFSYIESLTGPYAGGAQENMINGCWSLRTLPLNLFKKGNPYQQYGYVYFKGLQELNSLDTATNLPYPYTKQTYNNVSWSSPFNNTFVGFYRAKDITFATNEDGTPITAMWVNQVLDMSQYVGYVLYKDRILNWNSGITADKEVIDDATYQALKNDPDWFTCDINYSRYNHDSAVNTLNSLPDTTATGSNTIKFQGAAGALTDGGAINTLTEEEIAVAAAKGWTVSLV